VLLPFFQWMEGLAIYGGSIYLGPAFNIVHLCAMVTFLGALLVVDLRLLGAGLTHQPVAVVAGDARPWMVGALVVLFLTGVPALMATATAQYSNSIFWVKMYLIGFGLLFTFFVRNRVALGQSGREVSGSAKLVGLVSILVWLSVAALARLIMMIPGNTFDWLVGAPVR
jgi:hypothetical protein